ncbi:uncharacterized protein JCM15063_006332 [Sporobolomyces koalae]|uniref:uncharacterized protein n=1 Tax=Sporobolomyces koalae TaxID=500713 RepID=UPI00317BD7E0
MSLPPPAELLGSIRTSCAAVSLPVDQSAVDRFILSISQSEWARLSENHGVRLPLRFETALEELNVLAMLGLLNFLSGYRSELHRLTGRGAYSTILSLVLSAYLSADSSIPASSILTTEGMIAATVSTIASLAQITTHTEQDHPTLGAAVKVGTKDAQAFEICQLVVDVLHETGLTLQGLQFDSIGAWFKAELCRTNGDSGAMIHSMATTFPAFRDVHEIDSNPVYIFKKALWTLNAIHARFNSSSSSDQLDFPVPTAVDQFPVFADNVLPSMLVHLGILPASSSSPTATTSSTILRASSIYAGFIIVKRAHELASASSNSDDDDRAWLRGWNEVGLDGYLWSVAKEKGNRQAVERILSHEKGTVLY